MDKCILNLYKEILPMKYEITSLNTKKLFAEALKKIILQKSFSKVTVSELIRECGVNRKTFYYHFSDVYDLLKSGKVIITKDAVSKIEEVYA